VDDADKGHNTQHSRMTVFQEVAEGVGVNFSRTVKKAAQLSGSKRGGELFSKVS